jgi:hypothetical protein
MVEDKTPNPDNYDYPEEVLRAVTALTEELVNTSP